MMLELALVIVAVVACYFACSMMVGVGSAAPTGGARTRALELLAGDAGDFRSAVQRPWRPGSWRSLR